MCGLWREGCCLDCVVVEVMCWGEDWKLAGGCWSGVCCGCMRCVVWIGIGWYMIVSQLLACKF